MTDADKIYELVRWWEKRRWIYNGVMLVFGGMMTWGAFYYYIKSHPIAFTVEVVVFGFIANLAYTLGWLIPVYLASRRKNVQNLGASRNLLFVLGLLFSLIVTFGYICLMALNFPY